MPRSGDKAETKPRISGTTPISTLRGIGPKRASTLISAGISTVEDLLFHFPYRYEDRRRQIPIAELRPGMDALVGGRVLHAEQNIARRRNLSIFKATLRDDSGSLLLTWFNQPWLADKIRQGDEIVVFGSVEKPKNLHTLSMNTPKLVNPDNQDERGIVPVYQRIKDITPLMFRRLISGLLNDYTPQLGLSLPASVLRRRKLMPAEKALQEIHSPREECDLEKLLAGKDAAHKSLIFSEFFAVQSGLALLKGKATEEAAGIRFNTSATIRETLKGMLPFNLTPGQRQAFKEIVDDMTSQAPMRRLLQGDVGSGKTIVALLAAALAIENGYQAAFMAPTGILAEQHVQSIRQHCQHTGFKTAFLTGSLSSAETRAVRQSIESGEANLIVGTHALIQDGVRFKRLGLAVIDEQHRFGVLQRSALLERSSGTNPDLLIMTATPIPRSLTLTLFGDLSVSLIPDKPAGRRPVITAIRTQEDKPAIISFLKKETAAGRQVYWVCPRIDDNPEDDIRSAEQVYQEVSRIFGKDTTGLLHGRLNSRQQEETISAFAGGDLKILVSTTVIEVGVDVPNATVMLIENAERFGLSQLHQLRGRVGRGRHKSYCILLQQHKGSDDSRQRLAMLEESEDGFEIAEKDLELRGPGDFFGTRQSGVPTFRVGSLIRDAKLLEQAREAAFAYIADDSPALENERSAYLHQLSHQWKQKYGLILTG